MKFPLGVPQMLLSAAMAFVPCLLLMLVTHSLHAEPFGTKSDQAPATLSGVSADQVQRAVDRLQSWYDPQTGLWNSTGWWNSANALTALIDTSSVSRSKTVDSVIARTYSANAQTGFLNEYYDDEGWWALAWIDAYDLTKDPLYLKTASDIFLDMAGGWDETCDGGIWWSKERKYKNAIANELFLSVAANLASRQTDEDKRSEYVGWAQREWNWFRHSGMIEHDHLISDGLTSACHDNHRQKWSYNQGVILGGLVALARQPHQDARLRDATQIADAAIHTLADSNGILHDPCEPKCGPDGTQFKGIFVRNLAILNQRKPSRRYRRFILANAQSILQNDVGSGGSFGLIWSGPAGEANASTQSSALDALVAAQLLD